MKISYKLPLFFSGMLIATVLIVSLVGYQVTERSLRRAIISGMRSALNLRAEKIEAFFHSIHERIFALTRGKLKGEMLELLRSYKKKTVLLTRSERS